MKIYLDISNDLSAGIWRATHFFQSIGYPLILSTLRGIIPNLSLTMSALQATASCITLIVVFNLVTGSLGKKAGLISLLIGALHYPWILYANFSLPETFFTFFLSIAAWCTWKLSTEERPSVVYGFGWGLSFALALWLKGTHAFWGPMFLLVLLLGRKQKALPAIISICAVVSIGVGLHGYLTYKKIGKIQLSASTGGLNFIEGKCPDKVNIDTNNYRWHSPLYYQLELNSVKKWDRPFTESSYFIKEGFKCIKNDPLVMIRSFESIPFLFMGNTMWPFNRKPYAGYARLYELFFAVFLIAGLAGYAIHSFKVGISFQEFSTWVIPICAIFLCVYIFKSEMRYRVPFDIWFIPVAVKGWISMLASKQIRLS
jgi:hypothetical protein